MKNVLIAITLFCLAFQVKADHPVLSVADDLYERLAFSKAANYYKRYLEKHDDDTYALSRLASCYDKMNDYDNMESTLSMIVNREDMPDTNALIEYAKVLQVLGKNDEAAAWYKKYLAVKPGDRRAQNQLAYCEATHEPELLQRYAVENMDLNTDAFEYSPNLYKGELVYISTSMDGNTSGKTHNWTAGAYSDLVVYDDDQKDSAAAVSSIDGISELNTKYDDGPFTVDPLSGNVYYTRNNYNVSKVFNKKGRGVDNNMNLKIYIAGNDDSVVEFEHNFEGYNTGHPAISPDGKYLVFTCDVSDNEGVLGDRNLYFCTRTDSDSASTWSEPRILNNDINTEGDELFPYFYSDGSLFFSSDGLGSMGGLDIFQADIDFDLNSVRSIKRMQEPINSSYDDFGIVFKNEQDGYLTSDRSGGKGHDDIYSFMDNTILIKGTIVNADNDEPIPGADIKVTEGENVFLDAKADKEGRFEVRVNRNSSYKVWADAELFFENEESVSTEADSTVHVTIKLEPIQYFVKVINAKTKAPIDTAMIYVSYECTGRNDNFLSGKDGRHELDVYKNCSYAFKAKTEGYLAANKIWESPEEDADQEVVLELQPIVIDAPIVLKNIYYDYDSARLRLDESGEDLDILYHFLVDNPELSIQINSHTDSRASYAYNDDLSQRRAQSVVNYLLDREIDIKRIKAVGYGERKLTNHCKNNVKCTEEEHQMNRRTEFQIINVDGSVKIRSDKRTDIKVVPCTYCTF